MDCAYCVLDTFGNHASTCPLGEGPYSGPDLARRAMDDADYRAWVIRQAIERNSSVLVGSSDGFQMVFHQLRIVTVIGGHQLLAYCPCGWTARETYLTGGIPLEEMRAEYRDHVAPETPKEEQ